ncbi:MAG: lipid-A-disaccharide synthase [Isosphaeraceae bacterium]|jgi:lipid-A-disaccharide synthase|nr:MAG: lipid-A-disaccharide synthase [Isosphaeraceae bacterium]
MRVFISAGEPSGDLHAANLVRALRRVAPEAECIGFGGPRMARAGVQLLYPLTDLAIMWFADALKNLGTFVRLADEAERVFRDQRPEVLILIDYPGFHWHLARRAKRHGVPVVYYVPPQLWAWAPWRVEKMKRTVDLALCSLPFEPEWYAARGFDRAEYVGHPFFDELEDRTLDADFLAEVQTHVGPVVLMLPGSRTREIQRNLPVFLRAAKRLAEQRPDVRFVVSCLHARHAALVRGLAAREASAVRRNPGRPAVIDPAILGVYAGRTPELIRLADLAWAVSGSVSLELMHATLPTVILYTVRRLDLWVARPFIQSRFITLVNLLAGEQLMPEYLVDRDASPELANWALRWLDDAGERQRMRERLAALKDQVARPGASQRAAERIAEAFDLKPKPTIYRGPHEPVRVRRPGGHDDGASGLRG